MALVDSELLISVRKIPMSCRSGRKETILVRLEMWMCQNRD